MNQEDTGHASPGELEGTCDSPTVDKRILVLAPTRDHFRDLVAGMSAAVGSPCDGSESHGVVVCRNVHMCMAATASVEEALALLHRGYFNLVVLDARGGVGRDPDARRCMALLDAMESEPDVEARARTWCSSSTRSCPTCRRRPATRAGGGSCTTSTRTSGPRRTRGSKACET